MDNRSTPYPFRPFGNRRLPILLSGTAAVLLGGAILLGWQNPLAAQRRIQPVTPHELFKSGGLQSAEVLREISDTLRRIEKHLENIDQALQERRLAPPERPAPRNR